MRTPREPRGGATLRAPCRQNEIGHHAGQLRLLDLREHFGRGTCGGVRTCFGPRPVVLRGDGCCLRRSGVEVGPGGHPTCHTLLKYKPEAGGPACLREHPTARAGDTRAKPLVGGRIAAALARQWAPAAPYGSGLRVARRFFSCRARKRARLRSMLRGCALMPYSTCR